MQWMAISMRLDHNNVAKSYFLWQVIYIFDMNDIKIQHQSRNWHAVNSIRKTQMFLFVSLNKRCAVSHVSAVVYEFQYVFLQ